MIYQADAVLKSCIELMIEDMKANLWLLDDIFSNFATNVYLKKKYQTQIQNAKDWFNNNEIHIELGYVSDRAELPHISIVLGDQPQDAGMSTMGDASTETIMLLPTKIDKPIPFIVKAFTPVAFDQGTGTIEVPDSLKNFDKVVSGQIVVNITSGQGFPIEEIIDNLIIIQSGIPIGSGNLAILPKYGFYEAKVEHIWQNANYQIICTGGSDPQQAIWLHDICLYGLMRYKEGLLEALGLSESLINSGKLTQNVDMSDSGQVAWERAITITGKVEQTFIKAPHRLVESAEFKDTNPHNTTPAPTTGWTGGIKILSNSSPLTDAEAQEELWEPIEDEDA